MMQTPALPWIVRTAVAPLPAPLPEFLPLVSRITLGLPHVMVLDPRFTLGLVAPTGLARFWLGQPKDALVSRAGEDQPGAPPLRLLLRGSGSALAGVAPLVLGPTRFLGASAVVAPGLRLRVTDWRIHAGSLVGPGDFGSYLSLDWQAWGPGAARFQAPVARPAVLRRLAIDATGATATSPEVLAQAVETDATPGSGAGQWQGYGRRFVDG